MYGTILTHPNEFRSVTHEDGVATEARMVPRSWGEAPVVFRCGTVDYTTGTIEWSDGSIEFIRPDDGWPLRGPHAAAF